MKKWSAPGCSTGEPILVDKRTTWLMAVTLSVGAHEPVSGWWGNLGHPIFITWSKGFDILKTVKVHVHSNSLKIFFHCFKRIIDFKFFIESHTFSNLKGWIPGYIRDNFFLDVWDPKRLRQTPTQAPTQTSTPKFKNEFPWSFQVTVSTYKSKDIIWNCLRNSTIRAIQIQVSFTHFKNNKNPRIWPTYRWEN